MVKLKEAEKRQAVAEQHLDAAAEKVPEKKEEAKAEKAAKGKTEVKAEKVKVVKANLNLEDLKVILHPLVTEKCVNMIEAENKIAFIVSDKATKELVKKTLEKAYEIKVVKVNIIRDMRGRKKAIVKLDKAYKAQDLATRLGVL